MTILDLDGVYSFQQIEVLPEVENQYSCAEVVAVTDRLFVVPLLALEQ